MTSVWMSRPQFVHLGLFFAAYVLGCGFAQALAIVPGITVSIWPPGGIFIATLILTSPHSWPWWILAGCLAEMLAQFVWFHSPLPAGLLIYVGNALGAAVGGTLVNRACGRPVRLESLQAVLAFVVLGAGIAPLVSATVGSATLAWFGVESQTFTAVWPLFWIGDATGILLVAPPTLVAIQYWRGKTQLSRTQRAEAGVLGLIFLGVAALSLSGVYLPTPYIIMPPLLWAAARFEFRGAAVALMLLALITMALTISGGSQFVGDPESQRERQVMLQLFLAISAFSALIVAAVSRQHQQALLKVRQSEHQLQQMIDTVPAFIWCMTPQGVPSYLNKRAKDVTGVTVNDVVARDGSRSLAAVVHPDDLAAMDAALSHSIKTGVPYLRKYRRHQADGSYRWVESRAEPLHDESGAIVQWYGVAVDIEDVMQAQAALSDRERELSQLVDMVPSHVWRLTPDGEPVFFNKRMVDFIGMDVADTEKPGMTRLAATIEAVVHQDDVAEFENTIRRCLVTGEMFAMRYRLRRDDGIYHWMSSRAEPVRDKDGRIVQWYGICHDIQDQVHAEEAVRQSERDLRELVDVVPVAIACLDPDGEPTFFNKRMIDLLGLDLTDLDEPGGTSRAAAVIAAAVHPDDATEFTKAFNHALVTGEALSRRYRLRHASGDYRWVDNRIEPLRKQDGTVLQWYGVCIDIDDQMRLYSAVEEREAKIRRLVDSDIIGIVIWDLDGRLIDANDAFLRMVQYDRDDLKAGIDWLAMTPREWQEVHAREEAEELARTGKMQAREKEYFRKDGSRVPVLIGAACFEGQSRQGVAYILDLTGQKRSERRLQDRERELAQLVDTVPVQIWCVSPDGEPAYINKTMMDYIGMKLDDFDADGGLPSAIQTIVHPDDKAPLLQALTHSFKTGEPFELKFRNRRRDGSYRWTEGRAEPLRDESGRIVRWFGANVDIHDLVTSQEALRERERALSQLVETLPAMIDCATPDGEPVYRSQQLRHFLGNQLEEPVGKENSRLVSTLDAGVHPDDLATVKEHYARCLHTGEPYARRHRLRRFDGEYRWVETRAAPMRDAEGVIVQWNIICLDIDGEVQVQEELRLAQDRLSRASQSASLAELSASIAHEVNQPLAAVMANSYACQRWLTAEPPNLERAHKTVQRIIRDANAAADVVSRIRGLFKRSVEPRKPTELSGIVLEVRDLMSEEAVRRRVRIEVDLEGSMPAVALDRVHIQQVLVNLIRNGMDAMDSVSGDRVLGIKLRRVGDLARTEISDRGAGIEFPDKIFEPFFTTKANGMGMGLAICRSIVESHGGRLWAEKNEPNGASFIFALPIEMKAPS
ncbi:PAS domain-containing protein [Mesorhizobium yinganensis]|uniref:PAS domain-containing protein n=1 Tax=Mesorhizobium yinganensis TaxID=3157707 RepID=UPI0032B7BB96